MRTTLKRFSTVSAALVIVLLGTARGESPTDTNVDEAGRVLGLTLWHAIVGVQNDNGKDDPQIADMSVWATAGSLGELEELIEDVLNDDDQWEFAEIFSTDRVAFDERPDELSDLAPRRRSTEVHLVSFERRPGIGS